MDRVDCVVIGAGVIGLATARALALAGHEVIILEAENSIGTGTSSRNSEVIHAGIYYPKDSVKALTCVRGKRLLYEYCDDHGIPYQNCGKIIVATDDLQLDTLEGIIQRAAGNGVDDLILLSRDDVLAMEPDLTAAGGIYSPSTGIIDSHSLMLGYLGDAEDAGAMIAFNAPVQSGEATGNGIILEVGGDEPYTFITSQVVNSAGLFAQNLAAKINGVPAEQIPDTYYAKGNYYSMQGRAPFKKLIYPVPVSGGLGVHLTIDLGGQARFGPDVEWVDEIDYRVDPARADSFYDAVRTYWPGLKDDSLFPDYSGIRPKLNPAGAPADDFIISGPDEHGVQGLVNLFGIESPGLTASLAIADMVLKKLI